MDSKDTNFGDFPYGDEEATQYEEPTNSVEETEDDDDFFPTWQRKSFLEQTLKTEVEEEDIFTSPTFSYLSDESDEDDSDKTEDVESVPAIDEFDQEEDSTIFATNEEIDNEIADEDVSDFTKSGENSYENEETEPVSAFLEEEKEDSEQLHPSILDNDFDAPAMDDWSENVTIQADEEKTPEYDAEENIQTHENNAVYDQTMQSDTQESNTLSMDNNLEADTKYTPIAATETEEQENNLDAENVENLVGNAEELTENTSFYDSQHSEDEPTGAETPFETFSQINDVDGESAQQAVAQPSVTISSDLIRGHINTIILRTLSEGDRYGLEIIQEIERKTRGQYTIKQPTLYSSLKRLENSGFITSYWGSGETNGGRRRYYALTENGRTVTDQNRAEWEYSRTIIDNLISEREYDLSSTPPTAVDFSLLKNATTRVFASDKNNTEKDLQDLEEKREELLRKMEEEQDALDRLKLERDDLTAEITRAREETFVVQQEQAMQMEEFAQKQAEIEELKREQEELSVDICKKQEYANTLSSTTEAERAERDYKNILGKIFPQEEPYQTETSTPNSGYTREEIAKTEQPQTENTQPYEKYPDFWNFEEEPAKNIPAQTDTEKYELPTFSHTPETESYERNDNFSEFIRRHSQTTEERNRQDAISDYAATPKRRQGKIDFSDIFAYADRNQMRVRSYVGNKSATNQTQKNSLLFVNKMRALSLCLIYLIMMAELVLCYVLTADLLGLKKEFFYIALLLTLIPVAAIMLLFFASQKLIVPRNNLKDALLTSVIIIFNFFLMLIVLALILEVQLSNTRNLLLYFAYPLLAILNLPIYILIKNALIKTGKFNTAS